MVIFSPLLPSMLMLTGVPELTASEPGGADGRGFPGDVRLDLSTAPSSLTFNRRPHTMRFFTCSSRYRSKFCRSSLTAPALPAAAAAGDEKEEDEEDDDDVGVPRETGSSSATRSPYAVVAVINASDSSTCQKLVDDISAAYATHIIVYSVRTCTQSC